MLNPLDCEIDNDAMLCPLCGWQAPNRTIHRNCPKKMARLWWRFGDRVALILEWFGVTKEWWTGGKDCPICRTRQAYLNAIGENFRHAVRLCYMLLPHMLWLHLIRPRSTFPPPSPPATMRE